MDWAQTGNVATSAGIALAGGVFIVAYQLMARWWESPVGRNVMALAGAMSCLGAYTVLITVWPHGLIAAGLRCCRIVIGLAMIALLIRQTWLLLHTQREGRKQKDGVRDAR